MVQRDLAPVPASAKVIRAKTITIAPVSPGEPVSLAVKAGARPPVNTILYVHGIGNKPEAAVLKCQWDRALFGVDMGDRTRMAYWVSRERYPVPLFADCADGDTIDERPVAIDNSLFSGASIGGQDASDLAGEIALDIARMTPAPDQQAILNGIGQAILRDTHGQEGIAALDVRAKILPLPRVLRKLVTGFLTRTLLADVYDFLFDAQRQAAMEQALIDRLRAGGGPFVIVAHSQGSMIAYDVLRRIAKDDIDVRLLVTIGSPLGIREVQDILEEDGPLAVPPCVDKWVNVADGLDPVAADPTLGDDFTPPEISDVMAQNPDSPRHPHSATGYLRTDAVRNSVREVVGNAFSQITARTVLAKDLVQDIENGQRESRHEALIQLRAPDARHTPVPSLDDLRNRLQGAIESLAAQTGGGPDDVRIAWCTLDISQIEFRHALWVSRSG